MTTNFNQTQNQPNPKQNNKMNAILINPIVMASVLGAMMCLALYVVKCAIDERDALHEQQYNALYDKCKQLKQKVNTMAAEMSQMRLDKCEDGSIVWSDTATSLASIGIYPANYPATAIRSLKSSVERLKPTL